MKDISVLIPTYNHVCVTLVRQLVRLLQMCSTDYEVIVADDGSTDTKTVKANSPIATLPHCQYLIRTENTGRSAIRNFLVQRARYNWVLFIDSDMTILSDELITRYLLDDTYPVVDGGVSIGGDAETLKGNLRYRYEKAEESRHTAVLRQRSPYQHLHTANLLVRRDIMLQYPFDERFRHYGYEDVLLGKTLHRHHVPIQHLDNPVGFCTFETNADFVAKTEEGLRTLHTFCNDLRGYSRLLTFVSGIHLPIILLLIRLWHKTFKKLERKNLCGSRPSLFIFRLYRLGYYLTL